ncbi:MAG: NAD(P)H-binding protein [Chloroflexi bacterium]|nr:NAD(P)H-binding protein [Chloroflexota bacterium]
MNITVVGASGLIGAKVVELLRLGGHNVVAASRRSGVDSVTREGLADALSGADVLVDVTNSSEWDPDAVMAFFTSSTTNLVEAARSAGVGHYVALSIVGVDGVDAGYFRAKVAQERLISGAGLPYSIVRATQFAEFADGIIASLTVGDEVRVPDALIQPIPADDVAAAIARVAVAEPINGLVNIGGPRTITFEQMARERLARNGTGPRAIIVDPDARYYGAALSMGSLVTPDAG